MTPVMAIFPSDSYPRCLGLRLDDRVIDGPNILGEFEARRHVLSASGPAGAEPGGAGPAVGAELDRAAAVAALGQRHVRQQAELERRGAPPPPGRDDEDALVGHAVIGMGALPRIDDE